MIVPTEDRVVGMVRVSVQVVVNVTDRRTRYRCRNKLDPPVHRLVVNRDPRINDQSVHNPGITHSKTGRLAGAISISMLRARPGCRRINPARSRARIIW